MDAETSEEVTEMPIFRGLKSKQLDKDTTKKARSGMSPDEFMALYAVSRIQVTESEALAVASAEMYESLVDKGMVIISFNPTLFTCKMYRLTKLGIKILKDAKHFDGWKPSRTLY